MYADEAKGILKYGDEFLKGVKTVAKEGSEKLSKQMSKVIKSGKLDNVIASMDAGKHYIVKMRDGTVTAIEKTGLPEKIRVCLGNGCFIAGTLVTTRLGLKPIEEIVIGDYVLSRNEETGEDSYKKVTDTLVRSTQEICTIELENGNIKSTTGHLFMVKDKWWKAAVELVAGDVLVTSDGEDEIVKSIKVEEKGYPVTTYNLTIEDNHTFFVNNEGVLTHNMNNVLKGCNFATEASEKLTKGVSKADKLKISSWEYAPDEELYLKYKDVFDNPKYYNQTTGEINWPGQHGDKNIDGFLNGKFDEVTLKPGEKIDRYGSDYGSFASPEGISYGQRALAPGTDLKPYSVFEVIKPMKVKAGEIAPWFNEPGGGIQYLLPDIIDELLDAGIIRRVK